MLLPDVEGVVELLGGGQGVEVPRVAVVVAVFRVSADCNSGRLGDTVVDRVDGTERIYDDLVAGKGFVTAGLESRRVAGCGRVEVVDGGEDNVGITARSSVSVDLRVLDCVVH